MALLHGDVSFPGVLSVESATYTASHGISPGICSLVMNPQRTLPAQFGNLVFSDGVETVTIPDCRVDDILVQTGGEGTTWTLRIVDRRWRWRELGRVSGCYNQLDPHGKLIPCTIRSPLELATICLEEMGESGYVINLPPGLPSTAGNNINQFLANGINFPPTNTNPPVNWVGMPPAQALQQLVEMYGCRVIYQLATDSVLIDKLGEGKALPAGSLSKEGPALKSPETPDAVGCIGAPTRHQVRLALVPYGQEWDGSYKPINLLSYAPVPPKSVQETTITVTYDGTTNNLAYRVYLLGDPGNPKNNALRFGLFTTAGNTSAGIALFIVNAINASNDPRVRGKVRAARLAANQIVISGLQVGVPYTAYAEITPQAPALVPAGNSMKLEFTALPAPGGVYWGRCYPPHFMGVVATDRLTKYEAMQLAQKSVLRIYRLSGVDVSGKGAVIVPGYGPLQRIQQIVLQDTQVDQVIPKPPAQGLQLRDPAAFGQFVINFYNGYSKDKPAAVFGSINQTYGSFNNGIYTTTAGVNTGANDQVFVPFSVDPDYQQIIFSEAVFLLGPNGEIQPSKLILQTAVLVRDPDTNEIIRFTQLQPIGDGSGFTNPRFQVHEDVQLNITSEYNDKNVITKVTPLEADPFNRANYYLTGLSLQYIQSSSLIREYNGIRGPATGLDLDGAVQQITWSVGASGACTQASINCEHNFVIRAYPERRRIERFDAASGGPELRPMVNLARP